MPHTRRVTTCSAAGVCESRWWDQDSPCMKTHHFHIFTNPEQWDNFWHCCHILSRDQAAFECSQGREKVNGWQYHQEEVAKDSWLFLVYMNVLLHSLVGSEVCDCHEIKWWTNLTSQINSRCVWRLEYLKRWWSEVMIHQLNSEIQRCKYWLCCLSMLAIYSTCTWCVSLP